MNYRHAYHAGNFADVLKHAVVASIIAYMRRKDAAFRIIDTHAGCGAYDLAGVEASKTGEWRSGIGRLIGPEAEAVPEAVATILSPYLDVVRGLNPNGEVTRYPGSPLIAQTMMRAQDRLIANELHPIDAETLRSTLGRDRRSKVLTIDAWTALKSLLPPIERRGLVLVDPPFEEPGELERLVRGLTEAVRRFASGTYVLWYPVKEPAATTRFLDAIAGLALPKVLAAELFVRAPVRADVLNGCGLVIVNAPHTLATQLDVLLPFLATRLAQAEGGFARAFQDLHGSNAS